MHILRINFNAENTRTQRIHACRELKVFKFFRVPSGLDDVSKYPNLIAELLMRGWLEEDLMKITKRNILRVMRAVENYAAAQQETSKPAEEWIPTADVSGATCRT